MRRKLVFVCLTGLALMVSVFSVFSNGTALDTSRGVQRNERIMPYGGFDVQVIVDGYPVSEYSARGRTYVEAIQGAEYEVRVRNPLPFRVAVALSVDGLNTIDARRTSAWNASKWVIEPYGSITVGGWQMSSERARRFYFTTETDSYAAKLGQPSNLGVISAVFFRERRPYPLPVTPAPREGPLYEKDGRDSRSGSSTAGAQAGNAPSRSQSKIEAETNDDYAATGIGRSVHNDVRWVNMDLDSTPTGEVVIRYEYYPALVRLGILPRGYSREDTLRRRERAKGFDDRRFSPEP
jgi:hypothetical protein